jgi:ribose-phosphate pyrophosphokinase
MTLSDDLIFAGTSHPSFAQAVATDVGLPLGKIQIETFPDGEIGVQVLENVRGRDVYLVQTIARHPNSYLMETLIVCDALKRAAARSITAALPYFGYARQDRGGCPGEPVTARLVADLLKKAGVTGVVTMDLHTEQIQGFFDVPVEELHAQSLLVEAVKRMGVHDLVVVAPDLGALKRARLFAEALGVGLAAVDKRRVSGELVEAGALIGDVKGKRVVLVDDICSTGATLKGAARVCAKAGAVEIFATCVHGLMPSRALEKSGIEKLIVSNTIPLADHGRSPGVEVVSVAHLFGQEIRRRYEANN